MAVANPTAAPPMAAPGYGKRSAPGEAPRRRDDFTHLPAREASIATHIDRLPDGAAIDTKTLAKELPPYGQQAIRTALNALSVAGHLRRVREPVGDGRTQWVFRTYFSRTARSDAWWSRFLAGDVPEAEPQAPAPQAQQPKRTDAYEALAALGRTDARLTLSAAECKALEPLAAEWLARGVRPADFATTLTAGLPDVIHSPGAFTRKRLVDKLPPEPPRTPSAEPTPPSRIMECTDCGIAGRPEALPGGLCRICRGQVPNDPAPAADWIHSQVDRLRAAARQAR
ncbi:hypothetical protein [Streptomyces syringium]|uniref:MarR family transcriptional regulator n=1 Tax=Streptomyces syringium TaxID=76729 RepID=A0ABS4Y9A7_9ACTN|nr:hypothetical protein [Streptomyces syringium]MBP2405240.1 hypothetical protein [Streptomyces syringium]